VKHESGPLAADDQFFALLKNGDAARLDAILTDDFILIDVMSGSEVAKPALLELIGSGQLKFESIDPADRKVRTYGSTAVVTGRTTMAIRLGADVVSAGSRYTHVFVMDKGLWRLASAQGTQIVSAPGSGR
jgi:ketosteroid isomerase-like protein